MAHAKFYLDWSSYFQNPTTQAGRQTDRLTTKFICLCIYVYIYMYKKIVCACACVCVRAEREREGGRERENHFSFLL